MKVNKLDPCPFCGGDVRFNYNLDLEPDGIACMKCSYILRFTRISHKGKDAFGVTMQRLTEAWNRRVNCNEAK